MSMTVFTFVVNAENNFFTALRYKLSAQWLRGDNICASKIKGIVACIYDPKVAAVMLC